MTKATPPLPDWLLIRTIGSYFRPMSAGSIGRYGTSQIVLWCSCIACTPLLMASWCEPEKAVNTSAPAYGCLGGIVIFVQRS